MPRKADELSPLAVSRLAEPGLHPVGGVAGLSLQVLPSGGRRVSFGESRMLGRPRPGEPGEPVLERRHERPSFAREGAAAGLRAGNASRDRVACPDSAS